MRRIMPTCRATREFSRGKTREKTPITVREMKIRIATQCGTISLQEVLNDWDTKYDVLLKQ
jgi:hypothetical protein